MFQSRKEKLNQYIEELSEYNCVLCNDSKIFDNEKAKNDVERFFKQFIKLSPDKKYELGLKMGNHYLYLGTFLKMKLNLENKKYPEFCHELITLHHCENLLQRRIYFNMIELYNNYFEVKNESDKKNL
ncbi:MAG: hypothetical protein NC205_01320 [Prevotella sp.]|nr:hypothetical protein [Alistipes senegalensis]MCM1357205.1 hypothetical protein [Prevotella sp.]MCM1474305.1 hypothetical protein [Muribaculaceae bacterium]